MLSKRKILEKALMREFEAPRKDAVEWIEDEVKIEYPDVISAMETAIEVAMEETKTKGE